MNRATIPFHTSQGSFAKFAKETLGEETMTKIRPPPEEAEAGRMRVMAEGLIVREIQGGLRVWVRKLRPRKGFRISNLTTKRQYTAHPLNY
ncbi:hypothetical protein OIU74_014690 [Salix koriyanagi]|uniref:Uncharacterized protein n=1 Tax=Salix koriyanagi TaxID=2511006 RepID=A0A9Q0SZN6_9ROSI|nr:hypothetical protein OIU74_014690 [Salix koriyanagi]